ncbi:hypothetical protein HZH68_012142 [Vespula germanica]|uniref:Uncharacterized protein n=1 Tax=Vespula germanica TaxID=30212 RepID=A0A834MYR7_VESGE|nr:hypothetical protein HZH68_012142 [Vespula germanica]
MGRTRKEESGNGGKGFVRYAQTAINFHDGHVQANGTLMTKNSIEHGSLAVGCRTLSGYMSSSTTSSIDLMRFRPELFREYQTQRRSSGIQEKEEEEEEEEEEKKEVEEEEVEEEEEGKRSRADATPCALPTLQAEHHLSEYTIVLAVVVVVVIVVVVMVEYKDEKELKGEEWFAIVAD